jgi:hypothetical protein
MLKQFVTIKAEYISPNRTDIAPFRNLVFVLSLRAITFLLRKYFSIKFKKKQSVEEILHTVTWLSSVMLTADVVGIVVGLQKSEKHIE